MGAKQWFVVLVVCSVHFVAFSQRMNVVPFFIEMKDVYRVGYAEIGGLVSTFLLGYAFFQIPAGILADRYSPRATMITGLSTMLIASFLFVITHSLLIALILRFVMGASSAMLFSPGIKLISTFTPKEKRGFSVGMMEGAAGMGMLLTLTVFPVFSIFISWQNLFLGLSLLMIPLLILFRKIPKEDTEWEPGLNEEGIGRVSFLDLFRNVRVLRLMGVSFFGLFGLYAYLAWLPTYLQIVAGYSKQETGWIMALVMISQVIMGPVSGKVSDWMGQRKITLIIGSGLLALSAIWLFLFKAWGIYFIVLLIGTGISWSMAPMLALATEVVNVKMAGSVISVMNTVGQIASAISGYVYGLLFDTTGNFHMIWFICMAAFLIRIIFCLGNLEGKGVPDVVKNSKQISA